MGQFQRASRLERVDLCHRQRRSLADVGANERDNIARQRQRAQGCMGLDGAARREPSACRRSRVAAKAPTTEPSTTSFSSGASACRRSVRSDSAYGELEHDFGVPKDAPAIAGGKASGGSGPDSVRSGTERTVGVVERNTVSMRSVSSPTRSGHGARPARRKASWRRPTRGC